MLGMPYCSRWGGKHWKGQSLRAITNCLKLLEWVHLHNTNHIGHMQDASLWTFVAVYQPSLQSHCNGARELNPAEQEGIRLEAQG